MSLCKCFVRVKEIRQLFSVRGVVLDLQLLLQSPYLTLQLVEGAGGAGVGAQFKGVVFELLTVALGPLSHVGNPPVELGTISCCTLVLPCKHPAFIVLRFVRPSRDTEVKFGQSLRKESPIVDN